MTRAEAESKVTPFVQMVGPYQAMCHADAKQLLGAEGFERLTKDAIRRLGPTAETVYPWNVADCLMILDSEQKRDRPDYPCGKAP